MSHVNVLFLQILCYAQTKHHNNIPTNNKTPITTMMDLTFLGHPQTYGSLHGTHGTHDIYVLAYHVYKDSYTPSKNESQIIMT